jgi:hypothetical protein
MNIQILSMSQTAMNEVICLALAEISIINARSRGILKTLNCQNQTRSEQKKGKELHSKSMGQFYSGFAGNRDRDHVGYRAE